MIAPTSVHKAIGFALLVATLWMLFPLGLLALPLWDWPIASWPLLVGTLLGFTLAFTIGGIVGIGLIQRFPATAIGVGEAESQAIASFNRVVFSITIFLNLLALVSRAGFNPFTCGNLLECSNAAYQGYIEGVIDGGGAPIEYMRILFSPFIYAGIAMSVWALIFEEGRGVRKWAVTTLVSEVVLSIATGTSRSVANVLLFGLLARAIRGRLSKSSRTSPVRKLLVMIGSFTAIIVFFLYFSFLQLNRDGLVAAAGLMGFNGGYIEALSFRTGNDSFVLKGVESVVRYLCTGYFSLSLALGLTGGHTFPLGSSVFLAQRSKSAGDESFITYSLPGQIESHFGWSYLQQWHSIYSWLLSDYSVTGVAVIMFAIGILFTLSVYLALTERGAFAKLPFFLFFILVLYVPANNQLFQAPETAICFFAVVMILFFKLAHMRSAPAGAQHAS